MILVKIVNSLPAPCRVSLWQRQSFGHIARIEETIERTDIGGGKRELCLSWDSCSFCDPGQQRGKFWLLLKEIMVLRSEKIGVSISRSCHLADRMSAEADKIKDLEKAWG